VLRSGAAGDHAGEEPGRDAAGDRGAPRDGARDAGAGAVRVFNLPWPPSVNSYWRHVTLKNRTAVLISKEGRAYRELVGRVLGPQRRTDKRLDVSIVAFPPDARARDLDNLLKSLLDAMTHGGVWTDDSQIDCLQILRGKKMTGGGVRVVVTELHTTEQTSLI
jgi:crossover junction endodeoxyribonuclease RusA